MTRFAAVTAAAVLLGCGSAYAQARMSVSPLPAFGMTSPLGVPNAPVGHTGIPLGAIELATPGVSPTTSGAAPLIGATCVGASPASAAMGSSTTIVSPMTGASAGIAGSTSIAGIAGATPGLSGSALFDGGGITASAQGTCGASATASPPLASPGSPVGPAGIPLGSTELGGGGLSPPSVALSPNPSVPAISALTPLGGMTAPSIPSVSTAPSARPCPSTQNGVPTIEGVPTTFGAPLAGVSLGRQAIDGCN